jgi:flagellar biosynthetic protein FliS
MSQAAATAPRIMNEASRVGLLDQLYQRFLGDCAEADQAIQMGNAAELDRVMGHAVEILGQLEAALDRKAAPDLCVNLARLYDFARLRLAQAQGNLDRTALADAQDVVAGLRDAFGQAARELARAAA